MTPAASPRRDAAIDLLRGFALLTITINHLTGFAAVAGLRGTPFPTLSHYGFSSAAEIFFLLSGYLVGMVYLGRTARPDLGRFTAAMLKRAGRLYLYNLLLFVLLLPLVIASPILSRITAFRLFVDGGIGPVLGFLGLYIQPFCLEILAAYIALLLIAPAFAWLLLRMPAAAVVLSIAIWAVSYVLPWLRLPGGAPVGDWKWNFSPNNWQLLFLCALAAGRYRLLDRARAAFAADRRWFWAAAALLGALTLLFLGQTAIGYRVAGQSKEWLGPVRVLHALSVCAVGLGLFWTWPRLQQTVPARYVATVGAASLPCFVASVVISYATAFLWVELGRTHAAYLLLSAIGAVALLLFAQARRAILAFDWSFGRRQAAA